jgi:hypothetical protein
MSWINELFDEPIKSESRMFISMGLTWRTGRDGLKVTEGGDSPYRDPTPEELQKYKQKFNTFKDYGSGPPI